jgi:nicotinamide mononucleotide transporter
MSFFDIENVIFSVFGYPVSYVEFIGSVFGLICVYYATRVNILTWPTGLVNIICLFILFFQVRLYADMFLQIFFFVVSVYGWYRWKVKQMERDVSVVSQRNRIVLTGIIIITSLIAGFFISKLHKYFPTIFIEKAAFPYIDSFVMILSVVATILLARKKIENWHLWITVDVICTALYGAKQIYFISILYFIFLILASYGLYSWKKQLNG